ncbi:PREDICTED: uncharacterized protein LOC101363217 [Odobenus rosmarus divergens]|uniref:Uncharacterized protein LOC101363217 n=1 Tax=Odobenus rosmarus divergens TaxID=9708 RepID=A0A9B0LJM5_ODORO
MRTFQFVSATAALTTPCLLGGPGLAPPPPAAGVPAGVPPAPARRPGLRGSREVRPRLSGRVFKSVVEKPARRHVVATGGEGAGPASPHAGQTRAGAGGGKDAASEGDARHLPGDGPATRWRTIKKGKAQVRAARRYPGPHWRAGRGATPAAAGLQTPGAARGKDRLWPPASGGPSGRAEAPPGGNAPAASILPVRWGPSETRARGGLVGAPALGRVRRAGEQHGGGGWAAGAPAEPWPSKLSGDPGRCASANPSLGPLPRSLKKIAVAEYHKKIKEAFEVFDHEANNTVDVREIGTIVRSLGCCPSEGQLHDLLAEVEEEEPTGYIRFEKFLPVMTKVLLERRYRPSPEDMLLRAFEVLDPSKRGFLTREELIKYMTEEGEPFSQEEMEEMLSAAIDPGSNSIHYKDYIAMMVVDDS